MQNQAAVEALYSATFVEDYLDCVENLPNDLQRHLSHLRELDLIQYTEFLKDLDGLVCDFEKETTASGQRAILAKIQQGLIAAQDIGDDKLATVQALSDVIENKTRQLEHDAKNLDFDYDEDESTHSHSSIQQQQQQLQQQGAASSASAASGTPTQQSSISSKNAVSSQKHYKKQSAVAVADEKADNKAVKRRKKLQEKSSKEDRISTAAATSTTSQDEDETPVSTKTGSTDKSHLKSRSAIITGSGSGRKASSNAGQSTTSSSGASATATKRKQARRGAAILAAAANAVDNDDSDQDNDVGNVDIDPDEPTYCLCDQVSFGEMIGCDNDLCPIEWFHFGCVQLNNKPKGKWFCPKCRGDKPTTMKPKAQFLKELEKYNKEREEKMTKHS